MSERPAATAADAGPEPIEAVAPWRVALEGARRIRDDFEPRSDQLRMMEAVAETLDGDGDLVVEAGTGTGKTLAYLLPIVATGRKAVISTATRQLQTQLVEHDLPLALAAAGSAAKVAVLKGRSNYLCHERVERLVAGKLGRARVTGWQLDRVAKALRSSFDGDVTGVEGVAEDDPIWADVTSTSESCVGADCPFIRDCFVVRARRRALEADLVVVNHHVLLADYAIRERWEGAGLLPVVDAIVIDEAHALEDVVASFFGRTVSSRRLERLVADLNAALDAAVASPSDPARIALGAVDATSNALFETARALPPNQPIGSAAEQALGPWRDRLIAKLGELWSALATHVVVVPTMGKLRESVENLEADVLEVCAPRNDSAEVVRWVELRARSVALRSQPVRVAGILRRTLLAEPARRIFCSATLAVGEDFRTFRGRVGLEPEVRTLCLQGPFDYARQAMLYVDPALPEPFAPRRDEVVAETIRTLVAASGGGAFALFSSFRQMQDAYRRLEGRLGVTTLLQGQHARGTLLDRFRQEQPAVLFATMGFWQGVDVPGDALRLVILDKIPFPPPDDPVFAARGAAIESDGGSSFRELSIPSAAISLRQGFGRLIRRGDDRGVVAILDPRLATKSYGRQLVAALPAARRSRDLDEVRAFFARTTPSPSRR